MKTSIAVLCAAAGLAASAPAQGLTVTTSGTVARIANPQIQPCSTSPEPYYFRVDGTLNRQLQAGEEVRLYVSPVLLNGGPIFGCEWIKQCNVAVPGAGGAISAVGQFGTNNVPRSWFSGAQARVAFAVVTSGAPICVRDPNSISIALSNINTINIDPTIPTLFDFQIPCRGAFANVQGTPSPGQTLTYTLPSQGAVGFGLLDINGTLIQGCPVYFNFAIPLVLVSTDAAGVLSLPIPIDPTLIGADINSQGVQIASGQLDMTQPTYVSIR